MAEAIAIASGLDTVNSLLGVVGGLVKAILQAREEVRKAPAKTQQLLETVESAQSYFLRLENAAVERPLWNELERHLRKLAAELVLALDKLRKKMESDERRQDSNQVLETAKALLGIGASKQNTETLAIIQRLKQILGDLDSAVIHDSHSIAVASLGMVTKLAASTAPVPLPYPEHGLVMRMQTLAAQNDENLLLTTAVSEPGKPWHDPTRVVRRAVGIRLTGAGGKRAAREGGYEVPTSTKVRFKMTVSFDRWCFYVLTYDSWENPEPQVFFPKSTNNMNNWVSSERPRVFPSNSHRGDPIGLKVERSRKILDNGDGQVSIFLVLSSAPLKTDGAQQISIQDIEHHMDSGVELIVKHVLFDVSR